MKRPEKSRSPTLPLPLAMVLPGYRQDAPGKPGNPITISDDNEYSGMAEFRQLVKTHERQERHQTEQKIKRDRQKERVGWQKELLDREKTNARFGQLGVKRFKHTKNQVHQQARR